MRLNEQWYRIFNETIICVLITVCYISYSMEYKYFTLGITVVYGIVVSVMMVKNKIIAELFV